MDRKSSSIITDIAKISSGIEDIKGTQPFGYDASDLKMVTNVNDYDHTYTLSAGDRINIDIYCYNFDDIYPEHTIGYNQILFQVWVGNMSTPYYGESSGIGIFTPLATNSPFAPGNDRLFFEMINSSSSSKTVFIKAYAITTLPNAEVSYDT